MLLGYVQNFMQWFFLVGSVLHQQQHSKFRRLKKKKTKIEEPVFHVVGPQIAPPGTGLFKYNVKIFFCLFLVPSEFLLFGIILVLAGAMLLQDFIIEGGRHRTFFALWRSVQMCVEEKKKFSSFYWFVVVHIRDEILGKVKTGYFYTF